MKKIKTLWESGWLLTWMILLIVILIGHKTKLVELKDIEAGQLQKQITVKAVEINSLEQYNQALKDKLERSAKIETSQTQKEISRYYIKKYFGKSADIAEKIFTCESNLNPQTTHQNKDGTIDRGVAQINSIHKAQFESLNGLDYDVGAHDIELNIKFAKWLYDASGFSPWVCSQLV